MKRPSEQKHEGFSVLKQIQKFSTYAVLLAACLGSTTAQAVSQQVLSDGSFEATSGQGLQETWSAAEIGTWAVGDPFSIVGAAGAVSPLDGASMLAIDTTSVLGDVQGNIYQIVDVSSLAAEIDAGIVNAVSSVFYNSNATTDAGLTLHGFELEPLNFDNLIAIAGFADGLTIDGDANTWQEFTLEAVIPVGIRYLAFGMHEDTDGPIAYADSASLTLTYVPLPLPILLLGACCATLIRTRRVVT